MNSIDQKQKKVIIQGKEVVINELILEDIFDFGEELMSEVSGLEGKKVGLPEIRAFFEKYGPKIANIEKESIMRLTPSQLRQLISVFNEVNADFFQILADLGITNKFKVILKGNLEEVQSLPDSK